MLVPPMSNVMRLGRPSCAPETDAADDAARRPREERVDRQLAHRARRDRAAVRLHDARRVLDAEIADAALEALEIAVHDRHQARVHRRGRKALELAELGEHVARRAQIDLGPELLHERARALLVRGIGVGVQEADRDRFDAFLLQHRDRAAHVVFASGATSAPSFAMRPATSSRQSRGAGGIGFGMSRLK